MGTGNVPAVLPVASDVTNGTGPLGIDGCSKNENSDILVIFDCAPDFIGQRALDDDLLADDVLEFGIGELAPKQSEQRFRLVGLFLDLDVLHAHPVLKVLWLDDIQQNQRTGRCG